MNAADHQGAVRRDPDMFDIRTSLLTIWEAVRLEKWTVILTCALSLSLVTAYIILWPPVYEAQATIMVERDADPVRDTFYTGWNVFRKDDARTEIELMTSGPVLKEVVEREKLTYDDVYHPFMSHLTYLWGKSWVGRTYRSIKEKIFSDGSTIKIDPKELELGRTLVDMHAGIMVEPVAESNVGRLTVKGPSQKVAQVANTLIDVYLARRIERYHTEAKRSYDILTEEMKKAYDDLTAIERRRLAFLENNDLAFDFQKDNLEVAKLSDLERDIAANRVRIAAMEATLREVEAQLAKEQPTRTISTMYESNALRETAKQKRMELQTNLIGLLNRYREDSPEVQEVKHDLNKLDEIIASSSEKVEKATTEGANTIAQELTSRRVALQNELSGARAGLNVMMQTATKMNARLKAIPDLQAQLRVIDRDYGLAQEKYQQVLSKQAQASVSLTTTRMAMPSMRVVETAVPPQDKAQPKPKYLYPGALIIGLIFGAIGALLKTYASGRVRKEHIEGGHKQVPLYATVHLSPFDTDVKVLTSKQNRSIPG